MAHGVEGMAMGLGMAVDLGMAMTVTATATATATMAAAAPTAVTPLLLLSRRMSSIAQVELSRCTLCLPA